MPLDGGKREAAAALTDSHPGWLVVWGSYWRCWSAFALFAREPLVLHGADTDVLEARMREAEVAVRTRSG